jgi:hypothetical protein
MNAALRRTIVACCFLLCAGAIVIAGLPWARVLRVDDKAALLDVVDLSSAYQHIATEAQPELNFSQVESIIRQDGAAMLHHGRIEFGSARVSGSTALVEVLLFAPDGRIRPLLYKLVAENDSWKVASVQRMWFVPRSRLIRGLRA